MRIYTGAGDGGETLTLSGQTVSKNDALIHLAGAADELNAHLGLVKALIRDEFIEEIQINLMKLISHVSDPENEGYFLDKDVVTMLEREIDRLSANLPPLSEMVVPGKNAIEAQIHIARTVARKTERLFFAVNAERPLCEEAGVYLNRLSDYLFTLARGQGTENRE